jgi:flagellar biosynthesis/type III secretory pathway protein FliH
VIQHFEKERKMRNIGYVTTAERIGRREGLQQGLQEGLQEGLQQGLQLGEATMLILQLEHRFQTIPEELRARIRQADQTTLLQWAKHVLDAASLAEVFGEQQF